MKNRPQVGDVVRNVIRWGPGPISQKPICPGCGRIVKRDTSHCLHCKTTFVPVVDGYVQVIGVREHAP